MIYLHISAIQRLHGPWRQCTATKVFESLCIIFSFSYITRFTREMNFVPSCDTFVAWMHRDLLPASASTPSLGASGTGDGIIVFGKNSDRHPNEPMCMTEIAAGSVDPKELEECTYISIPPRSHVRYKCLLSKPQWMWGAEMGTNEHGLCIGNEALFTTQLPEANDWSSPGSNKRKRNESGTDSVLANKGPWSCLGRRGDPTGLLGMDMLRLALQYCRTSDEAMQYIGELVTFYGQNANAALPGTCKESYCNSFLIVDANSAWHMETFLNEWVAKKLFALNNKTGTSTKGVYAISNVPSIETDFDACSKVISRLRQENQGFNFRLNFADRLISYLAGGDERRCHVGQCLETYLMQPISRATNQILLVKSCLEGATATLTSHCSSTDEICSSYLRQDVCMHASSGLVRKAQTTNSWVSIFNCHPSQRVLHFATCTSSPCISFYKPFVCSRGVKQSQSVVSLLNPSSRFHHDNNSKKCREQRADLIRKYSSHIPLFLSHEEGETEEGVNATSLWWSHELLYRASMMAGFPLVLLSSMKEIRGSISERIVSQLFHKQDDSNTAPDSNDINTLTELWISVHWIMVPVTLEKLLLKINRMKPKEMSRTTVLRFPTDLSLRFWQKYLVKALSWRTISEEDTARFWYQISADTNVGSLLPRIEHLLRRRHNSTATGDKLCDRLILFGKSYYYMYVWILAVVVVLVACTVHFAF